MRRSSAPATEAPARRQLATTFSARVARDRLDGGAISIGEPRLRVADDKTTGNLALSSHAGIVAAEDAGAVTVWSLSTGQMIRRIQPLPGRDAIATSLALSPDGGWLAVASGNRTRVFKGPAFTAVELETPCEQVPMPPAPGWLTSLYGPTC
jgi:hypothetical protein